jgi:gas vesicle protein
MGSKTGFLVGFLVGVAVGWVLGIFSAPQSGKETLDTIGEKAIELRDRAGEAAGHVKNEVLGSLNSTAHLDADYTR